MIFVDRSIPRAVAKALNLVRDDVLWLEDKFPHDTPEAIWLKEVGELGWLVVSRDKKIRRRPGERRTLLDAKVGCFIIAQKQALTRWDYLKLLARTLDEMERVFSSTERPFIYSVGRTAQLKRVA